MLFPGYITLYNFSKTIQMLISFINESKCKYLPFTSGAWPNPRQYWLFKWFSTGTFFIKSIIYHIIKSNLTKTLHDMKCGWKVGKSLPNIQRWNFYFLSYFLKTDKPWCFIAIPTNSTHTFLSTPSAFLEVYFFRVFF